MRSNERVTGRYRILEDDNELWCPIAGCDCKASRCALAVFTEDGNGSNWYCGLVARNGNVEWNESGGSTLRSRWVKSVMRERA